MPRKLLDEGELIVDADEFLPGYKVSVGYNQNKVMLPHPHFKMVGLVLAPYEPGTRGELVESARERSKN